MHHAPLARLVSFVLLCSALFLLPATPARAAEVAIAATATPGVFEFLATGFEGDETVSTWVTGPSQQVQAGDYYDADGDGNVSFQMRIPRHFEPGRWAITIHGLDSEVEAIGYFDVAARGPDLTLTVSPASGPAGTSFAFSSTGFEAGESVSYWLTGPDGRAYEGGVADADSGGSVSFNYVIGTGTQPGTWAMSAYGQSSDRLAVATFTVS